MPSAGSSIFDILFGCCLGGRGQSSADRAYERQDADRGGEGDERTPLLGGRGNQNKGALNDAGGKTDVEGQASNISTAGKGVDRRAISRKRQADVAKLRAIRDQANDAFFYIDNSQILPSSSSSRPLNISGSQTFGGASKRDRKGNDALHQELVAESDKAERLYRAALSTPKSGATSEDSSLSPEEREAPLSLVRQMRLTIREAGKPNKSSDAIPVLHRKLSSTLQEAHARMGLDVNEDNGMEGHSHHRALSKLPSLHSLRTLRLSVQSLGSPSLGSELDTPRERLSSADEEDWTRRGRTRSKRGLAWIDFGPSDNVQQDKPKLHEMFNEQGQPVDEEVAAKAEEEVPNALRLSSRQTDTTKEVLERLKASTSIAEVWDSNQDN